MIGAQRGGEQPKNVENKCHENERGIKSYKNGRPSAARNTDPDKAGPSRFFLLRLDLYFIGPRKTSHTLAPR